MLFDTEKQLDLKLILNKIKSTCYSSVCNSVTGSSNNLNSTLPPFGPCCCFASASCKFLPSNPTIDNRVALQAASTHIHAHTTYTHAHDLKSTKNKFHVDICMCVLRHAHILRFFILFHFAFFGHSHQFANWFA